MASYLFGFTYGGGIPLFSRSKGGLTQLNFPVTGSLNGIHMFCTSNNTQLLSTTANDCRIVWKSYHDSITLILVAHDEDNGDWLLRQLLDLIFNTLVFMLGFDDIVNIKNVERTKKDLTVCFSVIDSILEFNELSFTSVLTLSTQTFSASENVILQTHLDGFTEVAQSQFGCLFVNGAVAVATKMWWDLSAFELVLLEHTVVWSAKSQGTCRESAIFLPQTSPSVPHRLLVFTLLQDVIIAVICGASPMLDSLMKRVDGFWQTAFNSLTNLKTKNFIDTVNLDKSINGFLVINTSTNRSLLSTRQLHNHQPVSGKVQNFEHCNKILSCIYRDIVGSLWSPPGVPGSVAALHERGIEPSALCNPSQNHLITDAYLCSDKYKCYALQIGIHRVLVLYNTSMPMYAMRTESQKLLQIILKEKWTTV